MPGPIPSFIPPEVFRSWFLCGVWSERQICVHFLLTHQARVYVYDECIIFGIQNVFFWPKTGRYSTFWDYRREIQLNPEGNYDGVKYCYIQNIIDWVLENSIECLSEHDRFLKWSRIRTRCTSPCPTLWIFYSENEAYDEILIAETVSTKKIMCFGPCFTCTIFGWQLTFNEKRGDI